MNCSNKDNLLELNKLPMYGRYPKTPKMLETDRRFIEKCKQMPGGIDSAVTRALQRGWEYYYKNDFSTSMKRFNQAWLLNSTNAETYWGFGLITGKVGAYERSVALLEKALELDAKNNKIMIDLALSYSMAAIGNENEKALFNKSFTLYAESREIDSTYELLYSNWAVSLFYKQDYVASMHKLKRAKELGGKSIDPEFVNDLKTKIPNFTL